MGEVFLTILVFFGVMVLTAVLFGGWVIVSLLRFVGRSLGLIAPRPAHKLSPGNPLRCTNPRCRADHPAAARFCRRCGQSLQAQVVQARRVAMW